MHEKLTAGYLGQARADERRAGIRATVVAAVGIVLCIAFLQVFNINQLKLLASALTKASTDCSYLQAPVVALHGVDAIQVGWTSSCRLDSARVKYTSADSGSRRAPAVLVSTGPLESWFKYTADIPTTQGQCLEYSLETDNVVLDALPKGKFCNRFFKNKQMDAGAFYAMGVADLDAISKDRSLEWAYQIRQLLASKDPGFIVDTASETGAINARVLEHVPRAPSSSTPAFAGWTGDVCAIFASSLDSTEWNGAADVCAGSQKTVAVLYLSWIQLLEYRLGTSGWWRSRTYTDYVATINRLHIKAAVLRTGRLYSIDVFDTQYCSDTLDCQPAPSVPLCGLVAQYLQLCPRVSGAAITSVFGASVKLEAYGIGQDMLSVANDIDWDDAEAELPVAERVEL